LISQFIFSYSYLKGLLSDPYQVIQMIEAGDVVNFEPVHPDKRIRKAIGIRANYKIERQSALHLGFRYYWDDWDITSYTSSLFFQQHINDAVTIGLGRILRKPARKPEEPRP